MRKTVKIIIAVCILIVIAIIGVKIVLHPSISMEQKRVRELIKKRYPDCEIVECKLEYVDWSSTISEVSENDTFYNRPTLAEATILVDGAKYDINMSRGLFSWHIGSNYSQDGVEVEDIEYYCVIMYSNIGQAADMEDWCKRNWTLPLDDGSLYRVVDDTQDGGIIYYSVKTCDALYMVENKSIKKMGLRDNDWTESDTTYSDLKKYGNYTKITEEECMEILRLKPQK